MQLTSISWWADVLTFVSLGLAIYNAVTISKVRNAVIARARLPTLTGVLEEQTQVLGDALAEYDQVDARRTISSNFSRLRENLEAVKSCLDKKSGIKLAPLQQAIASYKIEELGIGLHKKNAGLRDDAWRIYEDLQGACEFLRNMQEDQRLGRP